MAQKKRNYRKYGEYAGAGMIVAGMAPPTLIFAPVATPALLAGGAGLMLLSGRKRRK